MSDMIAYTILVDSLRIKLYNCVTVLEAIKRDSEVVLPEELRLAIDTALALTRIPDPNTSR